MGNAETDDELREARSVAQPDASRYRLLLEHLNVGVFVSSLDGRVLECNQRVVQMTGVSREQLLSRHLASFYEDPAQRQRLVEELRAHHAVRNFEFWIRHPNGQRWAALMNAALVPLGSDGVPLILGTLEDITARKLAEERAGQGDERFRIIAEQSMLGILIFQDDGIRFVNQAVADLNGYTIEEMTSWNGMNFARVIHPDDLSFVTEQGRKKQARDPSALAHYTYRVFTRAGELRWVEQYSRTIEYDGRPANFVTLVDVTARKQAEESLSQLAKSLERTAKLEALGVLAAGIAHDFNNLLSGLFGHLDLARAELDAASGASAHLQLAHGAFERAKALTTQLLAFAKGGAPVRKIGSLSASVKHCADFALSGSNVKVELDLPTDLWDADYDHNQVAQAFDNILINAKQAMSTGGVLRVVGANVTTKQGPAPDLRPGRYVKLSFSDTGPGIPPEVLQRVFDPFFTTKVEGSGVGLTATYAIIKKHDGHVDVESRPGAGATFHVWLPAVLERAPEHSRLTSADAKLGHGLVLVMDDDDTVRRVAGSMLSRLGYEPILTCEGGEALERARALLAEGRQLRAALLDLTVRVGDGGRDTVGPLRQLVPSLPIIASSGYSEDPVMAEPATFGFTASLGKPFRLAELGDLLARLVKP